MDVHLSYLFFTVLCIAGCATLTTKKPKTYDCDSCQRLDKLELLMSAHFKDFRHVANREKAHKDCLAAYKEGWKKSGIYTILPDGRTEMDVYCEQELDGGGWTVFQRRQDGSIDFYRNWNDYKAGFGDRSGEYWLGNDNIYILTKRHDQKLKVELRSPGGQFAYADYDEFWINNESKQYKLHLSGYSGANPPGDAMGHHDEQRFSTKDRDFDTHTGNCAQMFFGAWWYTNCHGSNLNGLYGNTSYAKGLSWSTWTGYYISMTGSRMMVKKANEP